MVWPPKRSATTPVRMPLRAAYTAAAAPAGPPPTISTSYGALALSLAASRAAAPVSSLARISPSVHAAGTEGPVQEDAGHGHDLACSTSSWNSAAVDGHGLHTRVQHGHQVSACTTSGQLWQVRLM
jgi:hypothetical protein